MIAIKLMALEGIGMNPAKPIMTDTWLAKYDPDAMDGLGHCVSTADVAKAMRFASFEAAFECWRQQSTVKPLRDDGKPNRPLTAFTVDFVNVHD